MTKPASHPEQQPTAEGEPADQALQPLHPSAPKSTPRPKPRDPSRTSIADFLTDGSLAVLAGSLAEIAGAPLTLRDREANTILPRDGTPPWQIVPPGDDSEARTLTEAIDAAVRTEPQRLDLHRTLVPLHAGDEPIGALLINHAEDNPPDDLIRVLRAVAATVSERVTEVSQLRRRNEELSVLFALTSELVSARSPAQTISIALDAALAATGLGAGLIHLLPEGDATPARAVARGLTTADENTLLDTLQNTPDPTPTSETGLTTPDKETLAHLVAAGPPAASIHASLVHNNRAIGELRLFLPQGRRHTKRQRLTLRNIAEQTAAAVASARLEEHARHDRKIRRQVALAAQVQQRLLPEDDQRKGALDIAARYLPSAELGGDFYDIIDLGDRVAVAIADVVGKGIPAALLMASARASLRAIAGRLRRTDDIQTVAARLNTALAGDTQPHEFTTAFIARIDPETRELIYTNAGHEPPFIVRCDNEGKPLREPTQPQTQLTEGGPLLGVDPANTYSMASLKLNPNDTLVAVTDGVTEAMDFEFNKFTRQRLHQSVINILNAEPHASARQIVDRIVWDVRRFAGLNAELDDLTVLAVRARPR